MRNPIRRNRNIGTTKQGHGKNNKFKIPSPYMISKTFYERLGQYSKIEKVINDHAFTFVIEETRASAVHACSVEDVERMIQYIPAPDYGRLKHIIFRQPKVKEELLSHVWGRLIYSYEFEGDFYPAIILEAISTNRKFYWKRSLSPDDQAELKRLMNDGHKFTNDKRGYYFNYEPEYVRNTQLYRTLLHEFGHYVHYLDVVERPTANNEEHQDIDKREEAYWKISKDVKERFAHSYADLLLQRLRDDGHIPFTRIN